MARGTDLEKELSLDNIGLDMDDLADIEAMEVEVKEDAKPKEKKEKGAKKEKAPKPEKPVSNYLNANELARQLEVTGLVFRTWLRKTYPEHQKGTAWKWEKGSKELQEVVDAYTAYKAGTATKKEKAETPAVENVSEPEVIEEIEIDFE